MYKKIRRLLFLLQVVFGILLPLFSQEGWCGEEKRVEPSSLEFLEKSVVTFTLDNGFRVLILERKDAPVFTGHVWVKVGGVDEEEGTTGIAHFFEHMAFKGTEKIGTRDYAREKVLLAELEQIVASATDQHAALHSARAQEIYRELEKVWVDNEFSRIYERNGENGLNAGTSKDYTFYTVELPKSAFELWCWMESERMLSPVFRQFYKEREVVQEERRTGYDDNPGGRLYELLLETAFQKHPYRFPTIGRSVDLKQITATQMKEFAKRFYRPDNAFIVLVGDVDPKSARPLIEQYFNRIPRGEGRVVHPKEVEPPQTAERTATLRWDAEPSLMMGYHKPTAPHPDDAYFALLHDLLAGQRSSFLVRELVLKKQIAASIATGEVPGSRYPQLFALEAVPRSGVTNQSLRDEIQRHIELFAQTPIAPEALESAKKRVRKALLQQMSTNFGLAMMLGDAATVHNDWRQLFESYRLILTAQESDVRALVTKYLSVHQRTYVHLEKKE